MGLVQSLIFGLSDEENYAPPDVWENKSQGGIFANINRPTAGPRYSKHLPRGKHSLQLYSVGTPNGEKVTMLLEALNLKYGLEYDAWRIRILLGEQFSSGFVKANPNSKIPTLLHYPTLGNEPIRVFETTAIMIYLCEQFDLEHCYLPKKGDPSRAECLSWVIWAHGSIPYVGGGFGHFFRYAPMKIKYALDRYTMETKRQLHVLDRHLGGSDGKGCRKFLCGDKVTIADIACYPWYGRFPYGKDSRKFIEYESYTNVSLWAARMKVSYNNVMKSSEQ